MSIRFNVNDHVRVQLTDLGRQIHRDYWTPFCLSGYPYKAPEEDAQGWSKFQLWDLMKTFGKHLGNGQPGPFATEIEILTDGV